MKFWPWELDENYKPHQRASALTLGRICNASVFLAQALKMKSASSDTIYTGVGTVGHRWIELMIQLGPEVADRYFFRNLKKGIVQDDFLITLRETWDWINESGLLVEGAERFTEQEFELNLGGMTITGHIDLVQVIRSLAIVTDWKFYNNESMLPPIREDMQMYAYAVGVKQLMPSIERIEVHRASCYHQHDQVMSFDTESIEFARQALAEETAAIWEGRTVFRPAGQCVTCLLRPDCPGAKQMEPHVDTSEIVPYSSGPIDTEQKAINVLVAVKDIEDRLALAVKACKAYVEEHGKLTDPVSGMLWGGWSSSRDTILDAAAALGELGKVAGIHKALTAAKTSKSAMEDVLKKNGVKPKDRKAFLEQLRADGFMAKQPTEDRWEWRKPKAQ